MKYAVYIGLLLIVVPVQTTVLDAVSVVGVRPDLCLVTAVLMGLALGRFEGLLVGLALGLVQDFFSAGVLGLNLVTKGVSGLLAGVAGRYVAPTTPVTAFVVVLGLSVISGLVFLLSGRGGETAMEALYGVWSVLLPQAVYDALVASVVYLLLGSHLHKLQTPEEVGARIGV